MDDNVDVSLATERAIQILSKNHKGFFLMVEWDLHPTRPEQCLNTVVALDKLIERTARQTSPNDTLIMFTADHSFDLRLLNGRRGVPLSFPAQAKAGGQPEEKPVRTLGGAQDTNPIRKTGTQEERPMSNFAIGTSHSGEEVLVAAQGPGSERVRGFMSNTDLFKVMMSAFRWTADKQ
jgi:alkaline phosphatase